MIHGLTMVSHIQSDFSGDGPQRAPMLLHGEKRYFFAIAILFVLCALKLSLDSRVIPRYLTVSTYSNVLSPSLIGKLSV